MRSPLGLALAGLLLLSVARCSTFSGDEASNADADAGATADATSEAGSAADGAVAEESGTTRSRFCAGADASFCDDFDDPGRVVPHAGWAEVDGGSLLALDDTLARSAPHALTLKSPAIPIGTRLRSVLVIDVPASDPLPKSITVAFDMNVSLIAATQNGYLMPLRLHFTGTDTAVGFTIKGTGSGYLESRPFDDAGAYASSQFGGGPPLSPSTWQHVVFVLDRESRAMTLTFDGQGGSRFLLAETTLGGPVRVELGAPLLVGDATQWKVSFDNVTLDVVR